MTFSRNSSVSLPGTFWGITAFFNPAGYANKYQNYRIFRDFSRRQGLKLIAIELAFGDRPFELNEDDADILIQKRGGRQNVMWQKERLLNLALTHLPNDCDKVAWLDSDIIFKNDDWVGDTSRLLEQCAVVQPYAKAVRLSQGVMNMDEYEIDQLKWHPYSHGKALVYGIVYGKSLRLPDIQHPGFAWVARREFLDRHGFFDKTVDSSADCLMGRAFYGIGYFHAPLEDWGIKVYLDVRGKLAFTPGNVLHLWHGEHRDRPYIFQHRLLQYFEFDPEKDIRIAENGLWEWASEKPGLHEAMEQMFWLRNEAGERTKSLYGFLMGLLNDRAAGKGPGGKPKSDEKRGSLISSLCRSLDRGYVSVVAFWGSILKQRAYGLYSTLKPFFPDRTAV